MTIPTPATPQAVAALIDHTILKADATQADVARLCEEALAHSFASVCVNPVFTLQVAAALRNSPVRTCVVVGFPLGANLTATKVAETQSVSDKGTTEIDMVIQVGALKSNLDAIFSADIAAVCAACHSAGAICKVIIETCLLSEEEKVRSTRLAVAAGADFVKTSTGFGTYGATFEDVALLRTVVGPHLGVKASGGIKNLDTLLKMLQAGATRIGTSSGVKIAQEAQARFAR
jgi:deoxyribose-phosphate aldolase